MLKPRRRSRGVFTRLLMVLSGIILLLVLGYMQLRPVVETAAAYQVRVYAAKILGNAVLDELGVSGMDYGDMVRVSKNNEGNVTSIESDMAKINRLKANVTRAVIGELEALGTTSIQVPLGTLFGNEFTSGRGPMVEIKLYPVGYVQTELFSQFSSAGINQTLHQIMLGTSVQMMALIPGYTIKCETSTCYCIAQTVIVGGIPESFTQINGDEAPLISKINDYADR